jgi:hypothetical protein
VSTQSAFYAGTGSTGRQLHYNDDGLNANGPGLWASCPLLAILSDPTVGYQFFDHFMGIDKAADSWIATQATSGTATAGVLAGGTVALSAGAATDNQGIQLQLAGGAFVPAASKHIWFECRLRQSQLASQFYAGLAVIDTSLIAAGALAHTDSIGFSSVTDDGVLLANTRAASASTTSSAHTLVADTFVRLGFVVNGVTSVTFYVNGTATATTHTANIPSAAVLTPSFVCQATGSGTPILSVDYVRVVQLVG